MNNAGVAQAGSIETTSIDDWRWIIDINLLGVVRGCRVFTPVLKQQRSGHLVNIASMAGLLDVPFMSSYNATKAAVVSLSETLQNELHATGIGVSVVCPSFFQTNIGESLRADDPGLRKAMSKLLARSAITAADGVIVATHLDGAPLDERHGAPLRLVSPSQYGYKSVKHLVSLDFCAAEPKVMSKEHLRARVAFEERHPRLPSWLVRLPYRLMIPPTAFLAERALKRHRRSSPSTRT